MLRFFLISNLFLLCACAEFLVEENESNKIDKSHLQQQRIAYDCMTAAIDQNAKKWTYRVSFLSDTEQEIFLKVSSTEQFNGKTIVQDFEQLALQRVGSNHFALMGKASVTLVSLENRQSMMVDHQSIDLKARAENGFCKRLQLAQQKEEADENQDTQAWGQIPTTIHFRFAGFIPCDVVGIPFSWIRRWSHYKGDNRSFDFDAAKNQSRASVSALISRNRIEAQSKWIGESQAFTEDQVSNTSGLCHELKPNERPGELKTDPNYDHQVWHSIKQTGEYTMTKTRLKLHATDPIPYGPVPSLDAYADIFVWWNRNNEPIYYEAHGMTDAFPSYELYVNGNRVYEFDAIKANIGPFGLVGHEIPFSLEKKRVPDFPIGVTP